MVTVRRGGVATLYRYVLVCVHFYGYCHSLIGDGDYCHGCGTGMIAGRYGAVVQNYGLH